MDLQKNWFFLSFFLLISISSINLAVFSFLISSMSSAVFLISPFSLRQQVLALIHLFKLLGFLYLN